MKTFRAMSLIGLAFLAACAAEEQEVIVTEERAPMEDALAADPIQPCDHGDEDGIGGTGCAPLE